MGNLRLTLESSLMLNQRISTPSSHRRHDRGHGDLLSDPLGVRVEFVARKPNSLHASLEELRLELGDLSQLGSADGSEIAAFPKKTSITHPAN